MEHEGSDNNGDNPPPLPEDSPALSQFVENMGLHYEDYGLSRIAGRIVGLLMITPRPISSEEMSEALQVSRSSISTNIRTLQMAGLVDKVSVPGDRVDYYTLSDEHWQMELEMRLENILPLKEMAEDGLEDLDEDHPARGRLVEMIDWVNMIDRMLQELRSQWQTRQEALTEQKTS